MQRTSTDPELQKNSHRLTRWFQLDSADTFDKAFDRADRALYLAKKQGRNQVVAG